MNSSSRPNILFVFTDQQTLRAMGAVGNPWLKTPNMDRLAREGVRFAKSYCASPVCGPSRASIATGRLPHEHRLIYNHDARFKNADAERLPTVGDYLREAGYEAYWIGKWHVDEFYPNHDERLHGLDFLPITFTGFNGLGVVVDEPVTKRTLEFLDDAPTTPWFLGVSWHNPHDICYWIAEEYRDQLDAFIGEGELPPLPDNFAISEDEPGYFQICRERKQYGAEMQRTMEWSETQWREYLRAYYRLTELADVELGKVLDALDRNGLAENTLVVFTSDHGEGCGAHKLVAKLSPYEEAASVPLIARLPGRIPAGQICHTHVASGIDLTPTFCDYAGAKIPSELPGVSLRGVLEQPESEGRPFAMVQVEADPQQHAVTARALCAADYKYMKFSVGEPREALYDLRSDPGETRNLATDPGQVEVLTKYATLFDEWQKMVSDPFPGQG